MIVAQRKPFDEIKDMIKDYKKVLALGCGTCVAVCLAGGEKEVSVLVSELDMAAKLADTPIDVSGFTIERQCDREYLEALDDMVEKYDALLSLACGAGIQFLAERYPKIPVFPAVDTTFIGVNQDVGWYEERCRSCSSCVLGMTGGICPVTMCAKGLYNGPCGGTNNGACEIDADQPCAWYMIYERLSKQDRLDSIMKFTPATAWKNQVPRTVIQPGYTKKD
ncbi:methylenetetrahydrofolate reductase C-terminal domain-containing protein [Desulfobacterales bacterium HSG16]|nr:methylenetetrahydrofolate reductase C-terminal domain-containing protein [Desulfobacterales bacterium HSG16]